ncbi:hypothetical protein [Halorubellus salinus]|uniref:hypothetical protein n=1 Tax=Halorubellus salinus TaxID=755309 RepID=UPI001D076D86|nr:hypothetical protein [Halorubellus salinus]
MNTNRRTVLKTIGVSTIAAGGLSGVSGARPGKPNARFDLLFDDAADAADNTTTTPGWVVDRRAPEGWSQAMFDGDYRLEIDVDETAETSGFYAYQGKKYQDADGAYWNAGRGSRLSYRFYVDPDWEESGLARQTGVWPVLGTSAGSISAYPILDYQSSAANDETGEAGFRAYVYESDDDGDFVSAKWRNLGVPRQLKFDPAEGGWVEVSVQLQRTSGGAALKWRVNNKLVADERGYNVFAPSTQFLEFIVNSPNFGDDATYYYDDFTLTEPGTAGND